MNSENESKKQSHVTVHGEHNIVIGGNVSGSNIIIGDNNRIDTEKNAIVRSSEINNAARNKKRLANSIIQSFSMPEIARLSFELGIDYDVIETNSKSETILSLIETIDNKGLFSKFLQYIKVTRPDVFDVITTLAIDNAG